jgi:hypothetical protein
MFVSVNWTGHVTAMGNMPGEHAGDVIIELVTAASVDGHRQLRVPSRSVTLAAEYGGFVGVQVTLPDGRRVFLPPTSVAAIIDAPPDGDHQP